MLLFHRHVVCFVTGIQKHALLTVGWCGLLSYVQDKRNAYLAERDAVLRHYVELHPEDFCEPRKLHWTTFQNNYALYFGWLSWGLINVIITKYQWYPARSFHYSYQINSIQTLKRVIMRHLCASKCALCFVIQIFSWKQFYVSIVLNILFCSFTAKKKIGEVLEPWIPIR